MIDTIKFLVPIDDMEVLGKLKAGFQQTKREDLKTGIIKFEFYSSEIEVGSHNKKIIVRVSDTVPTGLFLEFSVPKYAKGNNVEMIHPQDLKEIISKLYEEICTHVEYPLPHFSLWPIYRLDVCYNWLFKDLTEATTVMSFIQRIDYPRKQKYIYVTSVMYKGSAYTIKFYLKGPEFRKHSFKEIEINRALELQEWANKIVRFEISLKKKFVEELLGHSPVLLEHLTDDSVVQEILTYYLKDRVFRYITTRNTTEAQLEEILYANFTKTKATRLYQFYNDYFLQDGAIKKRINAGGIHRATVYRYKKDLKKLGIGFDLPSPSGNSLLEQLVIPSENSKFELVGFPEGSSLDRWNSKMV